MWIIRFHLLETKHYNKVTRIFKKYGFVPKKLSPIILSKACILHHTQRVSWRLLSRKFSVDHTTLYRFDGQAKNSDMLREIFHVFIDARVALYVGDTRVIDVTALGNSAEIYSLTQRQLESMLSRM